MAEQNDVDVTAYRKKAVVQSTAVGEYAGSLRTVAENVENGADPDVAGISAKSRAQIAEKLNGDAAKTETVVKGNEDLHIDHSLTGTAVQGNAEVGGGRGTINTNPDAVMNVMDGDTAKNSFVNLAAHEDAHATKQKPMGDILRADGQVTGWQLHEFHSERIGAEAEDKNTQTFNRAGQPENYAEAQKQGNELRELGVTDAEYDEYIGEGGDEGTRKLQGRVVELEIEQGLLTPEKLQKNLQEDQGTYARAAYDAITKTMPADAEPQVAMAA